MKWRRQPLRTKGVFGIYVVGKGTCFAYAYSRLGEQRMLFGPADEVFGVGSRRVYRTR